MRRLTPLTLVWMNYLYANSSGIFCEPEDFLTRVSIIQDEKDEIWEQLSVKTYPDEDQMQMSREEIENQIEGMKDMAQEFAEYAEPYFHGQDLVMQDLLEDVKKNGENSEYYMVANDYHEHAYTADKILEKYRNQFEKNLTLDETDFLMQQMMELQMSPKARENLQLVKQDLENRKKNGSDRVEEKTKIIAETNLNPLYNAKCWECYEDGSGRLLPPEQDRVEPLTPEQEGLIDTVEMAIDWGMPITEEQRKQYDRAIEQRASFEHMEQTMKDSTTEQAFFKQADKLLEQVQTQTIGLGR